ncbi:hypothetical protein HS7_20480 [Sulfolobales archaeon HS-7]|nr:hypothetical protein HS7_20480 [Sulfolobales archaeon HS-7]
MYKLHKLHGLSETVDSGVAHNVEELKDEMTRLY